MENEISVEVLRAVSDLERIRPAWESWPGNRESDIDFYLTVAGSSPETVRPHVMVISRGGRPDAILVGRLDRRRIPFRLGYLNFRVKADVLFFVAGPLRGNASPENCRLFVQEIRRSLSSGEAHAAYFHHLPTNSDLYSLVRETPGLLARDPVQETHAHFSRSLPATAEEFQRSLSLKLRSNHRWNNLARDFPNAVKVRCFTELAELEELIRDAEQVARTTYQRGLGVGFADTLHERERLTLKARKGWLRAYILYIAQRPAAFWIGDIDGTTFGGEYTGYDPAFRKYSPGMYLTLRGIEDLCTRVSEVDFGTGWAEYKEGLCDREWTEASTYIFAPSVKGLELRLARFLTAGLHASLSRALETTGFLRLAKRVWRARLRKKKAKETRTAHSSPLESLRRSLGAGREVHEKGGGDTRRLPRPAEDDRT